MAVHQVQMTWNADPDATNGYNVYRGSAAGQETTLLTPAPIVADGFTDSAPLVGGNFYVVKAVASNGVESAASAEVTTVILPAAPTGLTIVSSS